MFGVLAAPSAYLTEEQLTRYKACYCGLCRNLGLRYGSVSRYVLTYDMTFLVLLLSSLYEPTELNGHSSCIRHPKEGRDWIQNPFTDYAADVNVILAYYKCLDDWQDDGNPLSYAEAAALKNAFMKADSLQPELANKISVHLDDLRKAEENHSNELDEGACLFGQIMADIFAVKEDRWQKDLYAMGLSLGKFIYLMDAVLDLDDDVKHEHYNPFRRYYGLADNEQRFKDILSMFLGESVYYMDRLPLVQDSNILNSILCSGVWAGFYKKYHPERDTAAAGTAEDAERVV